MTTYREAGVDIESGDEFVKRIASRVQATFRKEVIGGLGGFGGLFRFPSERFKEPVLVSGTDGVGTKLKIAQLVGRHNTIGIDLVAMCVNDICVGGAEPLFFLDYLATGKLDVSVAESIVEGMIAGCQEAGCALLGGETAEMPSCYPEGEYDLAGFAVGVVERANIVDGSRIEEGDVLVGLPSTGLHSNGYTLARQVLLDQQGWTMDTQLEELSHSLGETLLEPTRIYAKPILTFLTESTVHGMAHITGGGLIGNLPRILPHQLQAAVKYQSWPVQPLFQIIQRAGNIDQEEMLRVFNMGIGLVLVVPPAEVDSLLSLAKPFTDSGYIIGEIQRRPEGGASVCFVN